MIAAAVGRLPLGAVPGDVVGSIRWFQHGYYKAKYQSGLDGLLMSRPLLEGTMRSGLSMTEPDVASSDARNISTSIVRDADLVDVREHLLPGRGRAGD